MIDRIAQHISRLAIAGAFSLVAGVGVAGSPVVVELFSSQGCSSCPPVDELATELAQRDDVIVLALHVDYWDYIGWVDHFANPAYTKRQKAYARAAGSRSIYTPQIVVEGVDHVVGYKPMQLVDLIRGHANAASPVDVRMTRNGGEVSVMAQSATPLDRPVVVQLVRYTPAATVKIERGENAGRTITYTNIVTEWKAVAEWDGRAPFSLSLSTESDQPVVAIFQEKGPGRIIAAQQLR